MEDIRLILSHFKDQLELFPRKMMTSISNGQFTVNSLEEMFQKCMDANYVDCRINAYPKNTNCEGIVRQPPDFIFIDLDLLNFSKYRDPRKVLDRTLKNTLEKILSYGQDPAPTTQAQYPDSKKRNIKPVYPTVLWTGNGYHIYLPMQSMVLDLVDVFSKDNFTNLFSLYGKYSGYSVSEIFLKYAEDFFTDKKADPQHRPKYKTCLIRIPNTFNSKCLADGKTQEESKVKIIQRWNGCRLPIQLLTKKFRRWITQEDINEQLKSRKNSHITTQQINPTFSTNRIDWIEKLLKTPLEDNRKFCLWRILIPYLLNVRKLSIDETTTTLMNWLELCGKLKQLDFNPLRRIKENIRHAKSYPPISKSKLQEENIEIYNFIMF